MHRRPFISFLVAAGLLSISTPVQAEPYMSPSRFGLGLELGSPSGLNAKYFLGGMVAIQGGLGVVQSWGYDGFHLHAEVVWHPVMLTRAPAVDIPLHVGIGGRFLQHDHGDFRDRCFNGRDFYDCQGGDSHLGVRVPVGVSFLLKKTPLDFFVEVAFVADLAYVNNDYGYDHNVAGLYGSLGGRYYF